MIIEMTHPGLPDAKPAKTTPEAFEQVWAKKGWRRVDEAPLPFLPPAETPAPKPPRGANQEG